MTGPLNERRLSRRKLVGLGLAGAFVSVGLGEALLACGRRLSKSQYAKFVIEDLQAELAEAESNATRIGLCVSDLATGERIFSYGGERRFSCGSTRKLYVIAASLLGLGRDYRIDTGAYSLKRPSEGVLDGDLFLRGSGDGLLTQEHLADLASTLGRLGLKHISGDIVGDGSAFTTARLYGADDNESDAPGDRALGFYAREMRGQVAGLSVDRGGREVFVAPAESVGLRPVVSVQGGLPPFALFNQATTTLDRTNCRIYRVPRTNRLLVEGEVGFDGVGAGIVADPSAPLECARRLRDHLSGVGISVGGKVRVGETPKSAIAGEPISKHSGPPLLKYLARLGQLSDSLLAESLLRILAIEKRGIGDVQVGLECEREILSKFGVEPPRFVDGCGIDPANRASPSAVCELLTKVATCGRREFSSDFENSLALSGEHGTLDGRITDADDAGRVRGKTGTLLDSTCLSGYLRAKSGKKFAFSLMVDGIDDYTLPKARLAVDRAVEKLIGAL